MKILFTIFSCVAILTSGFGSVSYSQEKYPSGPVELIVAHRAGGGVDLFFRLLAEELKKTWKVPVNVENRFSAGGMTAANAVAQSRKDGHAVLGIIVGILSTMTAVKPDGPVNLTRDFDPILINPGYASVIYVVKSDSKFKTLKDVINYAREKPGDLICGTGPRGSENFLEWELLKRVARVDITTLSYQGSAEVYPQLLGGHIQIGGGADTSARPYIDAGRMRPLVVDMKSPILPDVPTFAEAGYPEVNLITTIALLGPKGLPPAVTKAWDSAVKAILKNPEFLASLKKAGLNNHIEGDPVKMREFLTGEVKKYAQFSPEQLGLK
ncbi:MAG: tripartite tricarboxylate transporter substrate binding protein [Deltaproteobacteria bacterium]|nr:tripartite tricarboxylate transporter substrate binding protein [Deltaproteobacteria bacterium]